MPFGKPQYMQYTHHGLTFVLLCVPVLFADSLVVIAHDGILTFVNDLIGNWIDCRGTSRTFCVCSAV